MIDEKHQKWIRKKFPIFYTIKVNLQEEFTPTELDSLESQLTANRQEVSKQNQKALKKLKKLASQTQKQYRSNKELYNVLSTVRPEQMHEITLGHKKIKCLRPLENKKFLKLCEIDLAFNQVEEISALASCQLPSLAYFNLTRNEVKSLKGMENCSWQKLKILNLSDNQITSIQPLSNGCFPSLEKIELQQNLITKISCFHKSQSWDLKSLNLKSNRINSLKKMQRFCFTKLSELNLNENPIVNGVDIEKLQFTTIKNKKVTQGDKKISKQKGEEFIKYSYKLFYSTMIYKFRKEDFILQFFEEKGSNSRKNPVKCSKHLEYAVVDEYKEPEQKIQIKSTKKIHFD